MASESTETQTVTVSLPGELDDWLDDHAETLEVDRETLLVQLLSTYRTTAELDNVDLDGDLTLQPVGEEAVEAKVTEQVTEATNAVRKQLGNRIDSLESDYKQTLEDVRERVIQVKKDTDRKAPADHTHEELGEVAGLAEAVAELETELEQFRGEYDETVPDHEARLDGLETQLEQVQDRLQTVAWVVSDLREAQESDGGLKAVERIKRAAAKADIDRANCENCGEGVQLSLLTDPECPHCNATVSNVEPGGGWFSKPKLLVASQLESGEKR